MKFCVRLKMTMEKYNYEIFYSINYETLGMHSFKNKGKVDLCNENPKIFKNNYATFYEL